MKRNDPSARKAIDEVVYEMCRYISDHADTRLTLSAIAAKSGYSAAHLQRRFAALIGSSPKAYHQAARIRHLKRHLKAGQGLDEAIYGAGYGSPSRVYEHLAATFGMTPRQYRNGGSPLMIRYARSKTRLGWMLLGATERGICFLQFADAAVTLVEALHAEFPSAAIQPMASTRQKDFSTWMRALDAYLEGQLMTLDLPLDIRGTAFQTLVWRYLQTIPTGTAQSYRAVAEAIGKPTAARAVASACAKNRIAIAVPCHRVIRGDGDLSGYRWGVGRKRALLDLERGKTRTATSPRDAAVLSSE